MGQVYYKTIHHLHIKRNKGQKDPCIYLMLGEPGVTCPTTLNNRYALTGMVIFVKTKEGEYIPHETCSRPIHPLLYAHSHFSAP